MDLTIAVRTRGSTTRLAVFGVVDSSTVGRLDQVMNLMLGAPQAGTLVIDLAGVPIIDWSGVAVLVAADRIAQQRKLEFRVVGAIGQVRHMFDVARVAERWSGGGSDNGGGPDNGDGPEGTGATEAPDALPHIRGAASRRVARDRSGRVRGYPRTQSDHITSRLTDRGDR